MFTPLSKTAKILKSALVVVFLIAASYAFASSTAFADYSATTTFSTATTTGIFIVPAGVTQLNLRIVGGGGGGGGGDFSFGGGGGGSGSALSNITISVTPGESIPYIVGVGGQGGTSGAGTEFAGGNGSDGATSYFGGGLYFANGGKGGEGAKAQPAADGIGGLSGGVGGTNGQNGADFYGQRSYGGNGGTNAFGTGGQGGTGSAGSYTLPAVGTNGNGGGAGSGWAYYASGSDAGANGGNGFITISYTADLTAPVITINGANPLTIQASSTELYVDAGATAYDAFDATATPVITLSNNVNLAATGTYFVVYSSTDAAGNVATATRKVIVVDNTVPVIIAPATQIFEATGATTTPNLIFATATDAYGVNPIITVSQTSFTLGTTTVTWTATDPNTGNSATTTSLVIIKDTTPPMIVLNGQNPMNVLYQSTFVDPGATAYDLVSGTTTVVTIFDNVNTAATGTYSIVYEATDTAGNIATTTRIVNVLATAPTLTTITISPLNLVTTAGTSTQFIATTLDQYGNPIASSVFWGSSNTNVGTINFSTGLFNSLANGTTTITAVSGSLSASTTVTVTPIIVSTLPVNIANSFINSVYYASVATTSGAISGITGTTTLTSSTANNSSIDNSSVATSTVIQSTISFCTVLNSTLVDFTGTHCYIDPTTMTDTYGTGNSGNYASSTGTTTINSSNFDYSSIDNSNLNDSVVNYSSTTFANISFSTIINSAIDYATTTNSTIATSTVSGSTIASSTVTDSSIATSTITNSTVASSTISLSTLNNTQLTNSTVASSTLTNVSDNGSTITGTTLSNATTTDANIANGIIYSGTITIGGNTYVITTPILITALGGSPTLSSIAITTPANKLSYNVGDTLDVTGLVLTETFSNSSTATTSIINADVSGFDSSVATTSEILTITIGTATTSYAVTINNSGSGGGTGVTAINIVPSNPTITVGSSTAFSLTDQNNNPLATTTLWANSNGSIGSINSATGVFTAAQAGTTTITATVGALSASTTVIVVNQVASTTAGVPTIMILGSNPTDIVAGTTYVDAGATANDTIDGNITANIITTNPITASSTAGTYSVTYSVTDSSGVSTTSVRTVNITATPDTTLPVITILGSNPYTLVVGSNYIDQGATAYDSVDGNITADIVATNNVNTAATGTYQVNYSVTDGFGLIGTSTRTVNVIAAAVNTVPPTITIIGGTPITVFQNSQYNDQGATAQDNFDGNITADIQTTNNVNTAATGTYSVIYTVTDSAGLTSSSTRRVNVIAQPANTIPPVIYITGGTPTTIQVSTSSLYVDQGALAYSAYDNATTTATTTSNNVIASSTGSYSVTYSATDLEGNTSVATRMVNVVEATTTINNIPPVIYINGGTPITITVGSAYVDAGATAFSAYDNATTTATTTSDNVNANVIGTYSVVYSATDLEGNTSTATRVVNVIAAGLDMTAPVITVLGNNPLTLQASTTATFIDPGATAFDNVDGTTTVVTTGTVNMSIVGTYILTYTATDHAGNVATTSRTVIIVPENTVPPVITINGANPETIIKTLPYGELGATAMDDFDGNISSKIITTGSVNTAATGTYEIVYTVTDSAGLTSSSTRVVNVIPDNIPPVITILGFNPTNIVVGTTYHDAGATATDNVDGNVTANIIATSTVNTNVIGTYSVTYTVSDSSGNVATAVRTVNVTAPNTTPPVITVLGSNPDTIIVGSGYTDAGATAFSTFDNASTSVLVISDNVNPSAIGTYAVVYSSTDAEGNTATSTRVVNVVSGSGGGTPPSSGGNGGSGFGTGVITYTDTPTITILGSQYITILAGTNYVDAGATAYDNYDGNLTARIITTSNVNTNIAGTYTVKYSVTNDLGNTGTAIRTVVVTGSVAQPVATTVTTTATTTTTNLGNGFTATNPSITPIQVTTNTGNGITIPTNVGQQISSATTSATSSNEISASSTATSTNIAAKGNSLVATALLGLTHLSRKAIASIILILALIALLGLLVFQA